MGVLSWLVFATTAMAGLAGCTSVDRTVEDGLSWDWSVRAGEAAFQVKLASTNDPMCKLTWQVTVHPDSAGPSIVQIRRNGTGAPQITGRTEASPIVRAHAGELDTDEATNALGTEGPLLHHEGMSKTTSRPSIDVTVLANSLAGQGLTVHLACVTSPETIEIRSSEAWTSLGPGTAGMGTGIAVCSTCGPMGATAASEERLQWEAVQDDAELIFLTSGDAVQGSLVVDHPGGQERWSFPGTQDVRFLGPPGQYEATVDYVHIQSDQAPASYLLVAADWSRVSVTQA